MFFIDDYIVANFIWQQLFVVSDFDSFWFQWNPEWHMSYYLFGKSDLNMLYSYLYSALMLSTKSKRPNLVPFTGRTLYYYSATLTYSAFLCQKIVLHNNNHNFTIFLKASCSCCWKEKQPMQCSILKKGAQLGAPAPSPFSSFWNTNHWMGIKLTAAPPLSTFKFEPHPALEIFEQYSSCFIETPR